MNNWHERKFKHTYFRMPRYKGFCLGLSERICFGNLNPDTKMYGVVI